MKTRQNQIDAHAISERRAVGADDQGGQDRITPGQRVKNSDQPVPNMKRKGITLHDNGPDTWGLNKVERYEHD